VKLSESFIFVKVVTFLFFLINLFAVYLLLRGHNYPGGGFIGGLGSAVALILLSLAVGVERMQEILRIDPAKLASLGLLLAFLVATAPMLWGSPFLTQYNLKLEEVPLVGQLAIGTPLVFDIGIFLAVIGVTVKMIVVLARSVESLPALKPEERPRYSSPAEEPIEHGRSDSEVEKGEP
jgi:multicomponent Na+:H+ antiporter subunit B